jgi:arabinofuranosyltransferase
MSLTTNAPEATPVTSPRDGRRPLANRHVWQLVVLLAPVVFIAVMGWQRRYLDDDAFFNFRVIDQIWAGNGPVFNAGERVEMTTSTLWLVFLVVGHALLPFVRLEYLSLGGGIVLTGLGVWWAQRGAGLVWRRSSSALLVPLGALIYVAIPVSWDRATSGLENGLSIAWLGLAMLLIGREVSRPPTARSAWVVGVLLGLGPLVRPDLGLMALSALAAVCWLRRNRRADLAKVVVGFLALPAVVEIFRMGYYGVLVPNTAIAKDSSGLYWDRGWEYLTDFVSPYALWIPVVLAAIAFGVASRSFTVKPSTAACLALPIGAVLHLAYITATGGDYLHGRLLHTTLFALLAPVAAVPWNARVAVPWVLVAAWAIVAAVAMRPTYEGPTFSPRSSTNVVDGRELMLSVARPGRDPILATDFIFEDGLRAKRLEEQGRHAYVSTTAEEPLLDATDGSTQLLVGAAGLNGYLAGTDVVVQEWHGLADVVTSRFPAWAHTLAGHRKGQEPPWFVALATKPGVTSGLNPTKVAAARRALECGDLREIREATEEPLTIGRFFSNIAGSLGRTTLEVPRAPKAAVEKFCAGS